MSSVATNTLPASIALPVQRRGERVAFAEIEQMLDNAATRYRELQKETNRGEAVQKETQRRDTLQRDVVRETQQRQTQQQHDRANDDSVREPRRSATVASPDDARKNANASPVPTSDRVQNVVTPQSETNRLNAAPTVAKFSSELREDAPLTVSQSPMSVQSAVAANAATPSVAATVQTVQQTPQVATPTPVAASTAFTIFSSRGKLRTVDNDSDDDTDDESDDTTNTDRDAAGVPSDKNDAARGPRVPRGDALQLFTNLFTVAAKPPTTLSAKSRRTEDEVSPRESSAASVPVRDDVANNVGKKSAESSRQDATVELIQRVVAALQSAANRGDTVRIRMHPESLGSVAVRVRIRDGKMSASLRVETESARATLLSHRDALGSRLAEHGISLDEFEVEIF
ncbi:MAG: flagellar hook-length control protein FliK [Thermoguttaceae bacterium]